MMMRMVAAAGIPPLTDGLRTADEDNPHGYFELEAAKRTRVDPSWLHEAPGKVVKLVHLLLRDLPDGHAYRLIMMHRDLDEVLASQTKMLERGGKRPADADALKRVYTSQLNAVNEWVAARANFDRLDVNYADVLRDPLGQAGRIAAFIGRPGMAGAMATAVDDRLYRNRGPNP